MSIGSVARVAFIMMIVQSGRQMDLEAFIERAARLARRARRTCPRRPAPLRWRRWGVGSDDVAVFHDLGDDEERELLDRAMAWQREKFDAGYGALTWPVELGGAGLDDEFADAFDELEAGYVHPPHHETFTVTLQLVAPTLAQFGQTELHARLLPRLLRTEALSCQLFSEPGAGSDLGALATRAERDGDSWVVNGQKTWSSGARFAEWGELIARTDLDVPKHEGMTAFMLEMDSPGVTVRPIRQMSGGSSFNEVFFADVRVPDAHRLGAVGEGWQVALATLGFERRSSGSGRGMSTVGGSFQQLLALARWLGARRRSARPAAARRRVRTRAASRVRQRPDAGCLRQRRPGTVRVDRQADVDAIDDPDRSGRGRTARSSAGRRHRRVGHVCVDQARARRARLPDRRRE